MEIVAHFTANGTPLESPTDLPKIDIRRTDTGALVTTAETMTELGGGSYRFTFTTTPTLEYSARADGDPNTSGQVPIAERFVFGSFSGITEARIEVDIPQILTEISSLPDATDSVLSANHGAGSWDGITVVDSIASAVNTVLSTEHGAGSWEGVSTDVGSIAAEVDTVLSGAHGAGSWVGIATDVGSIAAEVDTVLSGSHGGGSWVGVSTDVGSIAAEVDSILSAAHGAGSWLGISTDVGSIAAEVDTVLTAAHGAGSWLGMATDLGSIAAEVDSVLTAAHGSGSWIGTATDIDSIAVAVNSVLSGVHGAGSWETEVTSFLAGVVDSTGSPSVTIELALRRIHAYCVNNINRSGNDYAYRDAGDTADLFSLRDNDPISRISSIT